MSTKRGFDSLHPLHVFTVKELAYFIRMPRDGVRCPLTNLVRAWLNKLITPSEETNDPRESSKAPH